MMSTPATDVEQPLLTGRNRSADLPDNKGRDTLERVRAVLIPKKKIIFTIQAACVLFYVVAIFKMHTAKQAHPEAGAARECNLDVNKGKSCSFD